MPSGLKGITRILAGSTNTVALLRDGTVVAWGYPYGKWCDSYACYAQSARLGSVTQVAAGYYSTLVLATVADCNSNGQRDTYEIMHGALDCDGNHIPDECDLASGAPDANINGRLDACEFALGDMDLNGIIDFGDVALIMLDFGPCAGCHSDLDGNGVVDFGDVAMVLLNFGPTG